MSFASLVAVLAFPVTLHKASPGGWFPRLGCELAPVNGARVDLASGNERH